ncbi:MAG: FAD-binding oxidoreductase [Ignavibacteriae bacterium]|nr:MAG: FAD-binding oxidoreductase [Ignavibacteriota bacterium]
MIIKTKIDEIENYLVDASNTKGFCDSVCFPETVDDIVHVLKDANIKNIPVTVSGNRTGVTGAGVPTGGIVISTEKLNKIIDVDEQKRYAVVEPGVLLSDLEKAVKEKNLFYPPDPTEKSCFIGGNVATNASGARTFKYGSTREYIQELEIVLPDGELITLERNDNFATDFLLTLKTAAGKIIKLELPDYIMPPTKNAAGYYCKKNMDAVDLFIGSEGTLGIVTKIKLKLSPLSLNEISCILFFNSEERALQFLTEARNESFKSRKLNSTDTIDATALELFDGNSLNFLRDEFSNIPADAIAAIWFEQHCNDNEEALLVKWINLFLKYEGKEEEAWFAMTDKDREQIINFRHAISINVNEYITKNSFRKLGTDAAVPDDKFIDFYYAIKSAVEQEQLDYVIYGHAGNSHLHLNMLPKTEDEFEKGRLLYKSICNEAIKLGGTFSAEHGVGKNKREYLIEMYGEKNVSKMRSLKKTLDPNYILGVGNIFASD